PMAIAYRRAMWGDREADGPALPEWASRSLGWEVTGIALLGTASLAQLKAVGDVVTRSVPHHAYEVLRARQPAWLNEWAAWFLSRNSLAWGPVRRLARDGLCAV